MNSEMDESHPILPPELQSVAAALSSLVPQSLEISRDQLLFDCGRAAALAEVEYRSVATSRISKWLWPLSTAALAVLCVTLALNRPQPEIIVQRPASDEPSSSVAQTSDDDQPQTAELRPAANSYAQLRAVVLSGDDWELPSVEVGPPLPRDDLPTLRNWNFGG